MKTILVDDLLGMMMQFKLECADLPEIELVGEFTNSMDALEFAKNNLVEFALLDIEMPGMNGVDLAKELRKLYPGVIIVFVTGHKEYLEDFLTVKADYYVLKPYTREDVLEVLQRAKLLSGRLKKRVFIHTFGSFDVFIDDTPIHFKRKKAKELLALLVDRRGTTVTAEEALDLLWEDRTYSTGSTSVYRVTAVSLRETLEEYGISDIIGSTSRGKYIKRGIVDCDLFAFLSGDEDAKRRFQGRYLTNYSWGEETLGMLMNKWQEE